MRNIEKFMIGAAVLAVGAGAVRNKIPYAEDAANISLTMSALTLVYDMGKAYLNDRKKPTARIIPIVPDYNQEV